MHVSIREAKSCPLEQYLDDIDSRNSQRTFLFIRPIVKLEPIEYSIGYNPVAYHRPMND